MGVDLLGIVFLYPLWGILRVSVDAELLSPGTVENNIQIFLSEHACFRHFAFSFSPVYYNIRFSDLTNFYATPIPVSCF